MIDTSSVLFGAAKEIITPIERMPLIGFASVCGVPFTDVHDDLYVRALILTDVQSQTVVLLSLDILFHDDGLADALRSYIASAYGIPGEYLHVSYTHTHFAPAVKGYEQLWYSDSYEAYLYDRCCRCIDRAYMCRRSGTVEYAAVKGDWNINRRKPVDGKILLKPNRDGVRDEHIHLLKCSDEAGKVRALLTGFACHPSNLADETIVSSEYPGRLCQRLEGELYGCTALFFQGFGADTKLKKGAKGDSFSRISYDECDEVAASMSKAIVAKLQQSDWLPLKIRLAAVLFDVELPLDLFHKKYFEEYAAYGQRELVSANLRDPKQVGSAEDRKGNIARFFWARADHVLKNYDDLPNVLTLPCGILGLAQDFYIFTIGGEPGIDLQNMLQHVFPEYKILCIGYTNAIAYIPSDRMISEGGYEATGSSICEYRLKGSVAHGVDEILCSKFKDMLQNM